MPPPPRWAQCLAAEHFDLEDEGRVGLDAPRRKPPSTIGVIRGASQGGHLALLLQRNTKVIFRMQIPLCPTYHGHYSFIPAFDNLAFANSELEHSPSPGRVKLSSIIESSGVVGGYFHPTFRVGVFSSLLKNFLQKSTIWTMTSISLWSTCCVRWNK